MSESAPYFPSPSEPPRKIRLLLRTFGHPSKATLDSTYLWIDGKPKELEKISDGVWHKFDRRVSDRIAIYNANMRLLIVVMMFLTFFLLIPGWFLNFPALKVMYVLIIMAAMVVATFALWERVWANRFDRDVQQIVLDFSQEIRSEGYGMEYYREGKNGGIVGVLEFRALPPLGSGEDWA